MKFNTHDHIHCYHLCMFLALLKASPHATRTYELMKYRMKLPKRAGTNFTFNEQGHVTGFNVSVSGR